MNYEMESPWMKLGGKISKKRTQIIWAENSFGTRFTQLRGKRRTKPSADEISKRSKFTAAIQRTQDIMQDLDLLEPYRQAWRAKVLAGSTKHHTLRGYVFAQIYKSL